LTTSLERLTGPDVQALLQRVPVAVLPFGSIEQHGPHLPNGTDSMASELIARGLAERLGALYAPVCSYGITPLHAGRAGTVSLRRETFEALVRNVAGELVAMGARTQIFVNWHEGNTPSLNAVATDLQASQDVRIFVAQACYVAQRLYRDQGGSLTHGGGIETLAVMAADASLVRLERAVAALPEGAADADAMRRSREVYGFITNVAEIAPDGWYGDPYWATPERSATFRDSVIDDIVQRLGRIGALPKAGP
jgi:creatinine amidohydrolase